MGSMHLRYIAAIVALGACAPKPAPVAPTPCPSPVAAPEPAPAKDLTGVVGIYARFKPLAGKEQEALAMFREVAAEVQKTEPGVLTYLFFRGHKDPGEIIVFEVYRDAKARQAHAESPLIVGALGKLPGLVDMKSVVLEWADETLFGFDR